MSSLNFVCDQTEHFSITSFTLSSTLFGASCLKSARIRRMTSAAAFPSRIILCAANRARSTLGGFVDSQLSQASPFATTAARG